MINHVIHGITKNNPQVIDFKYIVHPELIEGNWLGDPANFKGPAYCLDFYVERTSHVILTVHTTNQTNDKRRAIDKKYQI